jgi:hypothetical protein
VLLLAPGVTLLLVLANRAILKVPQTGEQHIHQVVLKPVKLVRDEGDDVQIPVGSSRRLSWKISERRTLSA